MILQHVRVNGERLPLDMQTAFAGIVLPLIWWIVIFLLTLPGNSRFQVPPWGLLLPLLALILLGAAILIMSSAFPASRHAAKMLVGAIWAGGICVLIIGIFTSIFSAIGLTNVLKMMFGIIERPIDWKEGIYYQTDHLSRDVVIATIFIFGFTPLWSAFAIFRRAVQLTAVIRKQQEVRTAIPLMASGAVLLFAGISLLVVLVVLARAMVT